MVKKYHKKTKKNNTKQLKKRVDRGGTKTRSSRSRSPSPSEVTNKQTKDREFLYNNIKNSIIIINNNKQKILPNQCGVTWDGSPLSTLLTNDNIVVAIKMGHLKFIANIIEPNGVYHVRSAYTEYCEKILQPLDPTLSDKLLSDLGPNNLIIFKSSTPFNTIHNSIIQQIIILFNIDNPKDLYRFIRPIKTMPNFVVTI
jgi:hypothetical protein